MVNDEYFVESVEIQHDGEMLSFIFKKKENDEGA